MRDVSLGRQVPLRVGLKRPACHFGGGLCGDLRTGLLLNDLLDAVGLRPSI